MFSALNKSCLSVNILSASYTCFLVGYFRTIAVFESVIMLVCVGLWAQNGNEPAKEGMSTTTRRYKTLKLRESIYNLWIERKETLGAQRITNGEFAEMLLHQNLGITRFTTDRDHDRSSELVLPGTATPMQGTCKTSQDNFKREPKICVSLSHYLSKLSFLF